MQAMAKFKLSKCICLEHPQAKQAANFYARLLAIDSSEIARGSHELATSPVNLYVDEGEQRLVLELLTPELEAARAHLVELGFEIISWDGPGKCNYVRDPFGLLFNIYESPDDFDD